MICPLLSKTVREKVGDQEQVWVEYKDCVKVNCGFWDKKGEQCGIATMGDIADCLWNK